MERRAEYLLRKPYLKPREVARVLNRPTRVVYYWLKIARLPGCKLGGVWIVPTARLMRWVNEKKLSAGKKVLERHNLQLLVMRKMRRLGW